MRFLRSPMRFSTAVLFVAITARLQAEVGVSGVVVDDAGQPVAHARVRINSAAVQVPRIQGPPVITGPMALMQVTDARGRFTTTSLLDGDYVACADAPDDGLLDPCLWQAQTAGFRIDARENPPVITITMARGAQLSIRLADAEGLLEGPSRKIAGKTDFDLKVHVVTESGTHYDVPIKNRGSNARDHGITVPTGAQLKLKIFASSHLVLDSSGRDVSQNDLSLSIPPGSKSVPISLRVESRK